MRAGEAIRRFVAGRTFEDYAADEQLRSAVERKFQIMGDALTRTRRDDPDALAHIRDWRDIISFRNIMVHGYDAIDDRIVWGIIHEDLGRLLDDAGSLIRE
jgi:uncharacterized protein with HEPN domain